MPLLLLASSLGGVLLAAPPASAQLTQNITMAATGSTTFDQSGSYNVDATTNDDDLRHGTSRFHSQTTLLGDLWPIIVPTA